MFIAIDVNAAVDVAYGAYINVDGDDSIFGVGAGGEFLIFRDKLDSPGENRFCLLVTDLWRHMSGVG